MEEHTPNWAEIAMVVVASVAAIGGAGTRVLYWVLGAKITAKSEELHKKIDGQRIDLVQMIADERNGTTQALAEAMRSVGEGLAAIRQKVVDVEIAALREHVRRDEFQTAMVQISQRQDATDSKIDRLRETVGDKLDRLIERNTQVDKP